MDIKHDQQIIYKTNRGTVRCGTVNYCRDDHAFLHDQPSYYHQRVVPFFNIIAAYNPKSPYVEILGFKGNYQIFDTLAGKEYNKGA